MEKIGLLEGFIGHLDERTKQKLMGKGIIKRYTKREHIFWDGDKVDSLYLLISGITSLYKLNSKDKKVIFINKPYNILNASALTDQRASASCEALTDVVVISYRMNDFIDIMKHDFEVSRLVMEEMSRDMKRMYRQLKNTSNSMNLEEQILSKLWKMAKDFGVECEEGIMIDFNCTISYLAEIVGSKRESVSRKVKILIEEKYIIYRKNRFIVVDMERISDHLRNV